MRAHRERGASLVVVALLMATLLTFVALAVDVGILVSQRSSAQSVADAAALAAAQDLPDAPAAVLAARTIAAHNLDLDDLSPGRDCEDGATACYEGDGTEVSVTAPYGAGDETTSQVRVEVCVASPAQFSRILGTDELRSCGSAVAQTTFASSSEATDCALCLLEPEGVGLRLAGSSQVMSSGGRIAVNSSSATAVIAGGSAGASVQPPSFGIDITGGYEGRERAFEPPPNTGVTPVPDPLIGVPAPSEVGSATARGTGTLAPGIYGWIDAPARLLPGLYVVTGGITAGGNERITGDGVTLYLTCDRYPSVSAGAPGASCARGERGAAITLGGNSELTISAPAEGDLAGIAVFGDRLNRGTIGLQGSPELVTDGVVYAAAAHLELHGSPTLAADGPVVVGSADLQGSPELLAEAGPGPVDGGEPGPAEITLVE